MRHCRLQYSCSLSQPVPYTLNYHRLWEHLHTHLYSAVDSALLWLAPPLEVLDCLLGAGAQWYSPAPWTWFTPGHTQYVFTLITTKLSWVLQRSLVQSQPSTCLWVRHWSGSWSSIFKRWTWIPHEHRSPCMSSVTSVWARGWARACKWVEMVSLNYHPIIMKTVFGKASAQSRTVLIQHVEVSQN